MVDIEEKNKSDKKYEVLARKYRPLSFEGVVGQDALVRTLSNAITNNRLHHAYILTGVRGTGKTTTARIVAKALNCIGEDGNGRETINPCGVCDNCKAIMEDRHVDVLELDAASRTGVNDIREILEGVMYKPVSARYKIYIIDEVHMLSKSAFNALLKTLEEPPAHVKFIFATTEIRKVPVTVLSRCQRFDLQRIDQELLAKHFKNIVAQEGVKVDDESISVIARAADGSARDGLSLLDQAIALSDGEVTIDNVREMIGLADKNMIFELFEKLASGKIDESLEVIKTLYNKGSDPIIILKDLMDVVHFLTKAKVTPQVLEDVSILESEKIRGKELSDKISMAVLTRIWQMLLKGINEVQFAPSAIDAFEMLIIRISYAGTLPTPNELVDGVKKNSKITQTPAVAVSRVATPQRTEVVVSEETQTESQKPQIEINSFEDIYESLQKNRKMILANKIRNDVFLKSFNGRKIEVGLSKTADRNIVAELSKTLKDITGVGWYIEVVKDFVGKTINDAKEEEFEDNKKEVAKDATVKELLNVFSDAKIEKLEKKVIEEMNIEGEE